MVTRECSRHHVIGQHQSLTRSCWPKNDRVDPVFASLAKKQKQREAFNVRTTTPRLTYIKLPMSLPPFLSCLVEPPPRQRIVMCTHIHVRPGLLSMATRRGSENNLQDDAALAYLRLVENLPPPARPPARPSSKCVLLPPQNASQEE